MLLTGLIVAFFSRSINERQLSNASINQVKVDMISQTAMDTILADLKQEIVLGSSSTSVSATTTLYLPKTPANAAPLRDPALTGVAGLENLIKRSSVAAPFTTTTGTNTGNQATGPASTTLSSNNHYISPARWNSHLLLAKLNPALDTDFSPIGTVGSPGNTPAWPFAPDWVVVKRAENPNSPTPPEAFDPKIHAVGGAIRWLAVMPTPFMTRAGCWILTWPAIPRKQTDPPFRCSPARKPDTEGSLAFADLKQLPGISSLSVPMQNTVINGIIGFRNYATAAYDPNTGTQTATLSGNFPGFTWADTNAANYCNFVVSNTNGFLGAANVPIATGNAGGGNKSVTDHPFLTRQEFMRALLQYTITTSGADRANVENALPYLGTFSRDLEQPSFVPNPGRPRVQSGPGVDFSVSPAVPKASDNIATFGTGNDAFGGIGDRSRH